MSQVETNQVPSSTTVPVMSIDDVTVLFSGKPAVKNVSFAVEEKKVTSMIGPSGSGKTTLLRSMNRLHEMTVGATLTGEIKLDGVNIYSSAIPLSLIHI